MKRILLLTLSIFMGLSSWANDASSEIQSGEQQSKGFSKEDIRWKPEFTARAEATIPGWGWMASLGVRINDKWTVGVMPGIHNTWHDTDMTGVSSFSANAYIRRYIHFGPKQRISLFVDGLVGTEIAYKIEYAFDSDRGTGPYAKGDTWLNAAIQPGIRLRINKNFHVFAGPSFGTRYFGLHAGIGF